MRHYIKNIIATALLAISAIVTSSAQTTTNLADSTATSKPQTPETINSNPAEAGDSAYAADNFQLAESLYLAAIEKEGTSSVLFYNLGNAYYRQGNLGKAIVNYERALKLDPTNSDARDNLNFVKSKIADKQIDEGSVMTTLWTGIICIFKADTWAWISVMLFIVFLAGLASYLFSTSVTLKKISFFGGLIVLLSCLFSIIVSISAAARIENESGAIILSPSAQLSTTPREARTRSEEAFLLHEGTRVEIVDSVSTAGEGTWYEVRVGNNERAWIKASEIERI